VIYCSILGRPYATGAVRPGRLAISTLKVSAVHSRDFALNASFEVCSFIAQITPKLDTERSIDIQTADDFLKQLQSWSSNLPSDMRRASRSDDESMSTEEQERMLGSIHVSCLYYFAVMLITRPFLVECLMDSMPRSDTPTPRPLSGTSSDSMDLAQACIDAAMLLSNLCHVALQSGALLKQMCVLK
jgi:hypothetical protein